MRKSEALKILEAEQDSTPQQAKMAYRRQAMKWHPDRNSEPSARAKFQEIGRAHKMLSELVDRGGWLEAEAPSAQMGERRAEARSPPPAKAPVKEPELGVERRGAVFFDSMLALGAKMMGQGEGAERAGSSMGDEFDHFLHRGNFGPNDLPILRGAFLLAFWRARRAGMFAAMARAKEWCARRGWAKSALSVIDPRAAQLTWDGGAFYIFDAAGDSLPAKTARAADLDFYKEWIAAMPELFLDLPRAEKSLRLGLFFMGGPRRPLWIEQALGAHPAIAGLFVEFGSPRKCGAKSDWLGMAIDGEIPASKLGEWLSEEDPQKLASRMESMRTARALAFGQAVEEILAEHGQWRLAGAWASPKARLLANGHIRWLEIETERTRPPALWRRIAMRPKIRGWSARCAAVWGPPANVEDRLASALMASGPAECLWVKGEPLAAACAMRAMFEAGAPLDFIERASAIERAAGTGALREKDSMGMTGLDWFALAIEHAKSEHSRQRPSR